MFEISYKPRSIPRVSLWTYLFILTSNFEQASSDLIDRGPRRETKSPKLSSLNERNPSRRSRKDHREAKISTYRRRTGLHELRPRYKHSRTHTTRKESRHPGYIRFWRIKRAFRHIGDRLSISEKSARKKKKRKGLKDRAQRIAASRFRRVSRFAKIR